jgi:tetratricopeptide (TPR) repeat protein
MAGACAALAAGCGAASPGPAVAVVNLKEVPAPAPSAGAEALPLEEPAPPPARRPRPAAVNEKDLDDDADREHARSFFQEGAEAYRQGDYPKALEKFQAAYDLVPEAALLFNVASAELRMGNLPDACAHFRKYVTLLDPADPRAQTFTPQLAQRCQGH